MSSIIFLAGDEKLLTENAVYMIHKGTMDIGGEMNTVYSNIEEAKRVDNWMYDLYAEHSDFTRKQIIDMMNTKGDVYFTAAEAVKHGFADGIVE